jgi:hypothetical protein
VQADIWNVCPNTENAQLTDGNLINMAAAKTVTFNSARSKVRRQGV